LTTIGLTGSVGAGKTTVMRWLAGRGAATLDADQVVHEMLDGDVEVIGRVVRRFGAEVRRVDGGVDRTALADRVFADTGALAALEAIVHPAVHRAVQAWLSELGTGVAVVEAVKLVQSGLDAGLTHVWVVTCGATVRRSRLRERGWSAEEVTRRVAASPPLADSIARADVIIDNSGTRLATERQLAHAWRTVQPCLRGSTP
jgi:dephospho-CoA kinase